MEVMLRLVLGGRSRARGRGQMPVGRRAVDSRGEWGEVLLAS